MNKYFPKTAVAFGVLLMMSGCATTSNPSDFVKQTFASDDPCSNNSRNIGMAVGAIGGTILAKVLGGSNNESLILGAATGTLIGGLIGADMDRRRCELSKIAKKYDLDITFKDITIDTASVSNTPAANGQSAAASATTAAPQPPAASTVSVMAVRDKETGKTPGHFEAGSDHLTPKAQEYFGAIAEQYAHNVALESEKDKTKRDAALKQYSQNRRILLVGHSDDTGSSRLNADLSERRARAVAEYLKRKGVPEANIYFQGAGEAYPVADNRTEEGRAANRRVEIVEAADESAFKGFLEARKPNLALYRAAPASSATDTAAANSSKPTATGKSSDSNTKTTSVAAAGTPAQGKQAQSKSTTKKTVAAPDAVASNVKAPPTATAAAAEKQHSAIADSTLAATGQPTSTAQAGKTSLAGQTATGKQAAPSAANTTTPSSSADKVLGDIDFGGTPATATNWKPMDIGQQVSTSSSFSFISTAHAADDIRSVSCAQDHPRHSGDVKNLATGKTYSIREFLPGAAKANWGAKVNGHFVGLNPVSVLRDGTTPAERPNLLIFKNWTTSPTPDSTIPAYVNAYVGDKGLLYRAFPEKGPIKCIDMLIDRANPTKGVGSNIIYAKNGASFQADYNPTITRN